MKHYRDNSWKVCIESLKQPAQGFDTAGGRTDYDDIPFYEL